MEWEMVVIMQYDKYMEGYDWRTKDHGITAISQFFGNCFLGCGEAQERVSLKGLSGHIKRPDIGLPQPVYVTIYFKALDIIRLIRLAI